MKDFIDKLKFNEKGLIPAIVQDEKSGRVLTLCYMNSEALLKTLTEGKVYVYRRSKKALMLKGKTSGHIQLVKDVFVDCEENSILVKVEQKVAGCHAGYFSCFYREVGFGGKLKISEEKLFNPAKAYGK